MKLEWQKADNSEIYGNYNLVDDAGDKLLDYGLWETCVIDIANGGNTKRQSIINELIDLIAPHINLELQSKNTGLVYKDVIKLFEEKIEELANKYFKELAESESKIKKDVKPKIQIPNKVTLDAIKEADKKIAIKNGTTNIHTMELHGWLPVNNYTSVMRVPGGWIYNYGDSPSTQTQCFVPYSNEFQGL